MITGNLKQARTTMIKHPILTRLKNILRHRICRLPDSISVDVLKCCPVFSAKCLRPLDEPLFFFCLIGCAHDRESQHIEFHIVDIIFPRFERFDCNMGDG